MKKIKPFLRWVVLAAVLLFLGKTLVDNWSQVAALRLSGAGWRWMAIAFGTTLLAHAWGGWVWGWILRQLKQPVSGWWSLRVYFTTNLAKYIPGNVWHFVGRVTAAQQIGVPLEVATLSVLLEPLMMAAAAALLALATLPQSHGVLQWASLAIVLVGVHPFFLNRLLGMVGRAKGIVTGKSPATPPPHHPTTPPPHHPTTPPTLTYPILPLVGELGFLILRGTGFVAIISALMPLQPDQILPLLGGFSLAWLTGLVVPGAPGGLGVFEATAIALLRDQFPSAILLSAVALYRLTSTLTEAFGAILVRWVDRWGNSSGTVSVKKEKSREG